jgi:hypothetical protein
MSVERLDRLIKEQLSTKDLILPCPITPAPALR